MFFLQEDRLFCTNLEVVNFQDSELGLFFGRSFGTIICFRNLLTFSEEGRAFIDDCTLVVVLSIFPFPDRQKKLQYMTFLVVPQVDLLFTWLADMFFCKVFYPIF